MGNWQRLQSAGNVHRDMKAVTISKVLIMLSFSLKIIRNVGSSLVIPVLIVLFMIITFLIILDDLSSETFLIYMSASACFKIWKLLWCIPVKLHGNNYNNIPHKLWLWRLTYLSLPQLIIFHPHSLFSCCRFKCILSRFSKSAVALSTFLDSRVGYSYNGEACWTEWTEMKDILVSWHTILK